MIRAVKSYLTEVPEYHFAPTSMTAASLVDALVESKRFIVQQPEPLDYNAMTITAEELTAFMHKYDDEMIGVLSAFYDPDPYMQTRRGKEIRIKIKLPQLNIISGTTPSNLMKFLPEFAWDQGFTSRVMMIFSDERTIGDDFAHDKLLVSPDLVHDLKVINTLMGPFEVTKEYQNAVNNWRQLGEPPVPNHPKLLHYNTRRRVHLYKLSMVAAVDRGNTLLLTVADFNRAMGWLREAELEMPEIFRAGGVGADARAMDEIYHFVLSTDKGKGVDQQKLVRFTTERVSSYAVLKTIDLMVHGNRLEVISTDKEGLRRFKAVISGGPL